MYRGSYCIILFLLLTACQSDSSKTSTTYKYIPDDANVVFKTSELHNFIINYKTHSVLSCFKNNYLSEKLNVLKVFNPINPSYISLHNVDSKNSYYVFSTKYSSSLILKDSINNSTLNSNEKYKLKTLTLNNTIVYYKILKNVFIASNNMDAIKNIRQNTNKKLQELIKTTDNTELTVFFKPETTPYKKLLFDITSKNSLTALDLNLSEDDIKLNGLLVSNDSIVDVINAFKNSIPQKNTMVTIAPKHSTSLLSFSYNDFSVLESNLNNIKKTDSLSFLNYTNEIALIESNKKKVLVAHTLDSNLLFDNMDTETLVETFKTINIYAFNQPNFFQSKLQPLITFNSIQYFVFYKNHILFSNTIDDLKSIITSVLNKQTLAHYEAYKSLADNLKDEASVFYYKNENGLEALFEKPMKGYYANAIQFTRENNYTYVNGSIKKYKRPKQTRSVTEDFTLKLNHDILVSPQVVKNHITETYDIIIQDVNNTMYLISNSGEILWQKNLQGKILGEIHQVDAYKNGRLQFAFATANRLYLIDRNSNNIEGFPLKFSDKITQPLSVFDYDNTKNYRLLITQDKNLIMYNTKGKIVNGFYYEESNTKINSQPKHFRLNRKDYIVFTTGERLKILNRRGKTRIDVIDKIKFSNNDVFLYKNKFTTTNTSGQLAQINTKGQLNLKKLNLPENHSISATSKTLVSMYENKLNIKSKTLDLDFGDYTKPKIFYLNNKIYVSTTDLQSKKVFLFNSQAKPISNFPIFGTSQIVLENIDKDKGLEVVTQVDTKTLVVYSIN